MRKLSVLTAAALGSLMLLGACGHKNKTDSSGSADSTAGQVVDAAGNAASSTAGAVSNGVGQAVAAATSIKYDCLPAHKLAASFDNGKATVSLDGKSYDLASVSADNTRYVADKGRTPGKSLVWVAKGTEGTLYDGKPGDATGAADKKIAACSPSK